MFICLLTTFDIVRDHSTSERCKEFSGNPVANLAGVRKAVAAGDYVLQYPEFKSAVDELGQT